MPTDPVAICVALADKLDMLVGFWAIEEKPTGSKDPYALRRAALGVIGAIVQGALRILLKSVILEAYDLHSDRLQAKVDGGANVSSLVLPDVLYRDLLAFFHDRLKVQLRESGARHDLVDAVLSGGSGGDRGDDLLDVTRRVTALGAFLDTEDGQNLLAGTRRAANILAAEEKKGTRVAEAVSLDLLCEHEEKVLAGAIDRAEMELDAALAVENYAHAMTALAELRIPVDAFFETVLVNAEDEAVRANRLALLDRIRAATRRVADFSRISG